MPTEPLRRRRWCRPRRALAASLAAVALAAGASSCVSDLIPQAAPEAEEETPPVMEVGACIRQSEGPTTIPPDVEPDLRRIMEQQQRFEGVDCDDERAIAKITAVGAKKEFMKELTDDGCPPDTDRAIGVKTKIQLDERIMCTRNLEAPHPGDPGGGGGKTVVGDCVFVAGGRSRGTQLQVAEMPCAEPDWFGVIVATGPDPAACPPAALSRLALPDRAGEVLCLAPEGAGAKGGAMPGPGSCIDHPTGTNGQFPPRPRECGDPLATRLEGFADDAGRCPGRQQPVPATGYDRPLCLTTTRR